jgi:uncharacterized protein YbaA (DUF1428 family)
VAYVDGFVLPVQTRQREAFRRMAQESAAIWKEHGATSVVECWGDDVPLGEVTSFPMAVKLEPGETVVFSWVVWPSREARDAGNAKVIADPRMRADGEMPFDMKRLIFGGFEAIVEA